jgi:NAD(P)-dependent dehydrogenase (short-subunit alcohol dehydrogenase family)
MSPTPSNPESRVWLITGASSGLGLALATHLLEQGQRVIATARREERLEHLAGDYPGSCRTYALDVTEPAQVQSVCADALSAFGRLDVLVNNAGYGLVGAFEECGREQIERNFAVNLFGALEVTRAVLPALRAQKSGHIVNISAAAAIANYPGFSIYGAAKMALEGVSESLAAELKPLGIKVTLVQPGPFRTDFIKRSLDHAAGTIPDYQATSGKFARFLASMDGKQAGDPAKAAAAILKMVGSSNPPLRLVLGKYANDKAKRTHAAATQELAAWAEVGLATEFSTTPAAQG